MKKQALIILATLFSSSQLMAQSPAQLCKLSLGVDTEAQAKEQVECLKAACLEQLTIDLRSSDDENEDDESSDLSVSEEQVNTCVSNVYDEFYKNDKEARNKKITYLKENLNSTDDLNELFELLALEDINLSEIKDLILDNVKLWDDPIVFQSYEAKIYDEKAYFTYLKSIIYNEINSSSALTALLDNGAHELIAEYIVDVNKLNTAIYRLKSNKELVGVILNNINSNEFSENYLKYAKPLILKDHDLQLRFSEILGDNLNNPKLNNIFLKTFNNDYKNSLWKYFVLASSNLDESLLEDINLNKRKDDIKYILNILDRRDITLATQFLSLLAENNTEFFDLELERLIEANTENIKANEHLLSYLVQNVENIKKNTILSFIDLSKIDYDQNVNVYNISQLAKMTLSDAAYYNFIIKQFEKHQKTDLLIYAAYNVNSEQLKGLIELTQNNGLNLVSNLNLNLIRNMDAWVEYTKTCVIEKCSNLGDLLKIQNVDIYKTILKHAQWQQALSLVSYMSNESNGVAFSLDEMNTFLEVLNSRPPMFIVIRNQINNIIKSSQDNAIELLAYEIDETISRANLAKRINDLRKGIALIKAQELDKANVTKSLLDIENVMMQMKVAEKGVIIEELYNLVKLEKLAVEKKVTNKVTSKSILSGLQNLYNQDYKSEWATNYIKNKITTFGTNVLEIDDENTALYEGYITKYALATANEAILKNLSYDEIDTLSKVMQYHAQLPNKINLQIDEANYTEVLKDFFVSFNNYFSTQENTQVNIPLTCDTGDICIYDMKYDQNIGALTSVHSDVASINFEQKDLNIYQNRDLNIIGSLNDVLFIDGSVAKELIPDQRSRAANGIHPKIEKRKRKVNYCVIRVKYLFGSACLRKNTVTLEDEYVAAIGFPPEDGLEGFKGANSSKVVLNLHKANRSRFAKIVILNNSGAGGKGQLGGIWEDAPSLRGRAGSGSSESDMTVAGVGFGFGGPGQGKRVSLSEAIPGYKQKGEDGEHGEHGEISEIKALGDSKSFKILTIGKEPK